MRGACDFKRSPIGVLRTLSEVVNRNVERIYLGTPLSFGRESAHHAFAKSLGTHTQKQKVAYRRD